MYILYIYIKYTYWHIHLYIFCCPLDHIVTDHFWGLFVKIVVLKKGIFHKDLAELTSSSHSSRSHSQGPVCGLWSPLPPSERSLPSAHPFLPVRFLTEGGCQAECRDGCWASPAGQINVSPVTQTSNDFISKISQWPRSEHECGQSNGVLREVNGAGGGGRVSQKLQLGGEWGHIWKNKISNGSFFLEYCKLSRTMIFLSYYI